MSVELLNKVDVILSDVEIPDRSTFFQLKNFVLGKEPTVHGQIWACLRNIDDRKGQIQTLQFEIENAEDDIALLNIKAALFPRDEISSEFHIRKLNRQIDLLKNNNDKLRKKIKYVSEELQYLVSAYEVLVQLSGGVKNLDDPQVQKEYWNAKLTEELNLAFLLKRPLNSDLVQTILALEDDMPVKKQMVQILERVQTQMIAERDRQLLAKSSEVATVELKKA